MSRIGRQPVPVPSGVSVKVDGDVVTVKGPKGELNQRLPAEIEVKVDGDQVVLSRPNDQSRNRALHGLSRTLVANMVEGVTGGYSKTLEIVGVGYRAEKKGKGIKLQLGFSHPIQYDAPNGISIEVPQPTQVVVEGIDKQLVGQVAADIRGFRPPEPYKGKGVRYRGEHVRRKAGKTAGA
jgi:large subunit ribosomal protein L6